jgi:Na+-translocating ferredoxin:NAD+ oxidoreductase RNF subunit RnfB
MSVVFITIMTLSGLGVFSAFLLYFTAQKFKVEEDPRIDQVEEVLPAANCGGCGFPGCHALAEALVKSDDISKLNCPVGGSATMEKVATILGKAVAKTDPTIAVVRCNGTCENRPKVNTFQGLSSCATVNTLYGGETGCSFGCCGLADCVSACKFDAIFMDKITGLPVVLEDKCVSCGACTKACPKHLIELRKIGPKSRRIYVSCMNKDKGALARKNCTVACIGCGKCQKVCTFDAITMENNFAYIDFNKCRLCRKCVDECSTKSIIELNFPPKKTATVKENMIN